MPTCEMLCLLQEVTSGRTGVLKCTNVGNKNNDVTVSMTLTLQINYKRVVNKESFLREIGCFLHLYFHPPFVPFHMQSSYSNESLPCTLAPLRVFGGSRKGSWNVLACSRKDHGKLGIRKGTWESEKRSALPMIPQVASAEALGYRQHE